MYGWKNTHSSARLSHHTPSGAASKQIVALVSAPIHKDVAARRSTVYKTCSGRRDNARRSSASHAPELCLTRPSGLHSHIWDTTVRFQALFWSLFFFLVKRWSRMRVSRCFFDSCEDISIVAEEMLRMAYFGGFLLDNRLDCSICITNSQNVALLREKVSDVRS